MSICRNSLRPGAASASARKITAVNFCIGVLLISLKEPREIDCHANPFARIDRSNILMNRKLHAARDGVVLINAQSRRSDEHLVAPRPRYPVPRAFQDARPL